jgi:bla regulator protein blaR1
MKAVLEFFDAPWLQILGYTLLHSVWQAFIVAAAVILALRFIPNRLSAVRYCVASLSLMVIISLSIGTLVYLNVTSTTETSITSTVIQTSTTKLQPTAFTPVTSYFNIVSAFIQSNVSIFLMVWILGTSLFSMRILTGLVYLEKVRRDATLLHNEWSDRIHELAERLRINRLISLAESSVIQVPILIGHFKPMILIPIGMCTSLSTEQLETIFIHEIAHIRRKDYLINLLQVVVEAIYFFNPFVWIVSAVMKREREHCCDDAVVQLHGNAKAYAHALATLDELRLSKVGLSLSLAENKNQLLNRVKRLMEKSVKNYSGRERIIPAVLLVIGLICASWISAHTSKTELSSINPDKVVVASDTIKKNKKIGKNKKADTTTKEIATNKQEQDEESELEHNLSDAMEFETDYAFQFNQGHFPVPENDFDLPGTPSLFESFGMQLSMMLPPGHIQVDSPGFHFNENNWEEFSKEFEENFKAKFEDFYQKHQEDIQHMLEDVQNKVNGKFDKEWELKVEDFAQEQAERARSFEDKWHREAELLSQHDEHMQREQERLDAQHREFERNHARLEENMKALEESNRIFEEKLKEELIKDGYLGKDEKLETIHWQNGKLEINGKKIKPEDEKKYNEIYKKRFEGCQVFRYWIPAAKPVSIYIPTARPVSMYKNIEFLRRVPGKFE